MATQQRELAKLAEGDKVRFSLGTKIREVTEVSDDGQWFKWGGHEFWCSAENYVKMPRDSTADHTVG